MGDAAAVIGLFLGFFAVVHELGNLRAEAKEAKEASDRTLAQIEIIHTKLSEIGSRVRYIDERFSASKTGKERWENQVKEQMRQAGLRSD